MKILLIFLVSLTPLLLSLLRLRQAQQRWEVRLRQIRSRVRQNNIVQGHQIGVNPPRFVGDLNCVYNARSIYLRCGVNPSGPCENCPHYQSR